MLANVFHKVDMSLLSRIKRRTASNVEKQPPLRKVPGTATWRRDEYVTHTRKRSVNLSTLTIRHRHLATSTDEPLDEYMILTGSTL
jgi:hypothetical protein